MTIASILLVTMMPHQQRNSSEADALTAERMRSVEEAMRKFMALNKRRPCPASGDYAVHDQYFGREAATPGTCTGGLPAANLADGGNVVGGVIPVKALGLTDEYAFDGWGRYITYYVDKRATLDVGADSCATMGATGSIEIRSGAAVTPAIDNVMVVYIGAGKDGFGAFPPQGSNAAGRMNTGSTDVDQERNASVDGSFAVDTANMHIKIKKETTTTFDDIVSIPTMTKNTCAI